MKLLATTLATLFILSVFSGEAALEEKVEASVEQSSVSLVADFELDVSKLSARAFGVFDIETGEILLTHNASEVLPIASVTKLFTAAAVLAKQAISEVVIITYEDVATEGRSGNLMVNQTYTAHELLFPLLLESSNDAATALMRTIDGEVLVADRKMADGSGLSARNQASVIELMRESTQLYQNFPHVFDITTLSQYVGTYTGWKNNSPVRNLPGYRGGKHGYTNDAGRTLLAVFAEEHLDDREFGYIILGSDNIVADVHAVREIVKHSVQLQ